VLGGRSSWSWGRGSTLVSLAHAGQRVGDAVLWHGYGTVLPI
jgi:hypothetical protein